MTMPAALAHALELIGERWALLVLRELMLGPRRFSDLQGRPAGISANVLTQRLTELEAARAGAQDAAAAARLRPGL